MGPALLPESLERLKKSDAIEVIAAGRPTTQMQGFADKLSSEAVAGLAQWIYAPVSPPPQWGEAQIRASRVVHRAPGTLPDRPRFDADPMNLFIVVEQGDHHVSILDGDRLEPIHRFPSRYALHGGPKFTPDGRYVFFASRDGWQCACRTGGGALNGQPDALSRSATRAQGSSPCSQPCSAPPISCRSARPASMLR